MRVLFAGLPATGKSTFLFALYHLLDSGEVADSLRLASLSEDRAYINDKIEAWLSYKETERTSSDNEAEIEMTLLADDKDIVLHIPDLAGEHFERCLTERQWSQQLGDDVRACNGVLLFMHSQELTKAMGINQLSDTVEALSDTDEPERIAPFLYEKSPTQILLVDLLQLLHDARGGEPFKVALIVSAYDLVTNPKFEPADKPRALSPAAWLEAEMPLLAQYLKSTFADANLRIYGVSAQGGDLTNPEDKTRLENTVDASERVWVLEGERQHADLSAPIRWLTELEG